MKSLRIGLVDLDTSHPGSFVPLLRKMGHEITTVYDTPYSVNPSGFAEVFAREHAIAGVSDSLQDMAEQVDAVFIHSCNWDVHVLHAAPFIEAGKAVFIDKPMTGNVRDLNQMIEWSRQGATITGGSSLRYCPEVIDWVKENHSKEDWVYGVAGCGVDDYNYGIHAYTMLHGLLGSGIASSRFLSEGGQKQVELVWRDGRRGTVSVGKTSGYLPFYATLVTQTKVEHIQVDNSRLYEAMLDNIMPYIAGEAEAPLSFEELAEVERAAIAAQLSKEQGGAMIPLAEISEDYQAYDGAAFARFYKKLKFPEASNS